MKLNKMKRKAGSQKQKREEKGEQFQIIKLGRIFGNCILIIIHDYKLMREMGIKY